MIEELLRIGAWALGAWIAAALLIITVAVVRPGERD